MKNIDWKPIGNFAKEICGVAVFGLAMATPRLLEMGVSSKRDNKTVSYSDAVDAIMGSGMLDSSKKRVMSELKQGADEDYYKAVIRIVKSGMLDSSKVETISCLYEK